jgi:serine/threonine protein phosphatase PrpC
MHCETCGLDQPEGNRFCEDCGASLVGETGAGRGRPDDAAGQTRLEVVVSPRLAGVSDRGRHHSHNEDFLALAACPRGEILVVCDGVSSSPTADAAAEAAATATCAALCHAWHDRPLRSTALTAALRSAEASVRALPFRPLAEQDPPETTIVAAVHEERRVSVAWLGDSRAYLVTPAGAMPLTEDHSWINEVVASGTMTRAEARRAPLAHAVTRTLGGRDTGDEPSLRTFDVAGPALLVLCTDGLWNSLPEPWQLAELLRRQPAGADALALARALVQHALDHDGRDNITAAILCLEDRAASAFGVTSP